MRFFRDSFRGALFVGVVFVFKFEMLYVVSPLYMRMMRRRVYWRCFGFICIYLYK